MPISRFFYGTSHVVELVRGRKQALFRINTDGLHFTNMQNQSTGVVQWSSITLNLKVHPKSLDSVDLGKLWSFSCSCAGGLSKRAAVCCDIYAGYLSGFPTTDTVWIRATDLINNQSVELSVCKKVVPFYRVLGSDVPFIQRPEMIGHIHTAEDESGAGYLGLSMFPPQGDICAVHHTRLKFESVVDRDRYLGQLTSCLARLSGASASEIKPASCKIDDFMNCCLSESLLRYAQELPVQVPVLVANPQFSLGPGFSGTPSSRTLSGAGPADDKGGRPGGKAPAPVAAKKPLPENVLSDDDGDSAGAPPNPYSAEFLAEVPPTAETHRLAAKEASKEVPKEASKEPGRESDREAGREAPAPLRRASSASDLSGPEEKPADARKPVRKRQKSMRKVGSARQIEKALLASDTEGATDPDVAQRSAPAIAPRDLYYRPLACVSTASVTVAVSPYFVIDLSAAKRPVRLIPLYYVKAVNYTDQLSVAPASASASASAGPRAAGPMLVGSHAALELELLTGETVAYFFETMLARHAFLTRLLEALADRLIPAAVRHYRPHPLARLDQACFFLPREAVDALCETLRSTRLDDDYAATAVRLLRGHPGTIPFTSKDKQLVATVFANIGTLLERHRRQDGPAAHASVCQLCILLDLLRLFATSRVLFRSIVQEGLAAVADKLFACVQSMDSGYAQMSLLVLLRALASFHWRPRAEGLGVSYVGVPTAFSLVAHKAYSGYAGYAGATGAGSATRTARTPSAAGSAGSASADELDGLGGLGGPDGPDGSGFAPHKAMLNQCQFYFELEGQTFSDRALSEASSVMASMGVHSALQQGPTYARSRLESEQENRADLFAKGSASLCFLGGLVSSLHRHYRGDPLFELLILGLLEDVMLTRSHLDQPWAVEATRKALRARDGALPQPRGRREFFALLFDAFHILAFLSAGAPSSASTVATLLLKQLMLESTLAMGARERLGRYMLSSGAVLQHLAIVLARPASPTEHCQAHASTQLVAVVFCLNKDFRAFLTRLLPAPLLAAASPAQALTDCVEAALLGEARAVTPEACVAVLAPYAGNVGLFRGFLRSVHTDAFSPRLVWNAVVSASLRKQILVEVSVLRTEAAERALIMDPDAAAGAAASAAPDAATDSVLDYHLQFLGTQVAWNYQSFRFDARGVSAHGLSAFDTAVGGYYLSYLLAAGGDALAALLCADNSVLYEALAVTRDFENALPAGRELRAAVAPEDRDGLAESLFLLALQTEAVDAELCRGALYALTMLAVAAGVRLRHVGELAAMAVRLLRGGALHGASLALGLLEAVCYGADDADHRRRSLYGRLAATGVVQEVLASLVPRYTVGAGRAARLREPLLAPGATLIEADASHMLLLARGLRVARNVARSFGASSDTGALLIPKAAFLQDLVAGDCLAPLASLLALGLPDGGSEGALEAQAGVSEIVVLALEMLTSLVRSSIRLAGRVVSAGALHLALAYLNEGGTARVCVEFIAEAYRAYGGTAVMALSADSHNTVFKMLCRVLPLPVVKLVLSAAPADELARVLARPSYVFNCLWGPALQRHLLASLLAFPAIRAFLDRLCPRGEADQPATDWDSTSQAADLSTAAFAAESSAPLAPISFPLVDTPMCTDAALRDYPRVDSYPLISMHEGFCVGGFYTSVLCETFALCGDSPQDAPASASAPTPPPVPAYAWIDGFTADDLRRGFVDAAASLTLGGLNGFLSTTLLHPDASLDEVCALLATDPASPSPLASLGGSGLHKVVYFFVQKGLALLGGVQLSVRRLLEDERLTAAALAQCQRETGSSGASMLSENHIDGLAVQHAQRLERLRQLETFAACVLLCTHGTSCLLDAVSRLLTVRRECPPNDVGLDFVLLASMLLSVDAEALFNIGGDLDDERVTPPAEFRARLAVNKEAAALLGQLQDAIRQKVVSLLCPLLEIVSEACNAYFLARDPSAVPPALRASGRMFTTLVGLYKDVVRGGSNAAALGDRPVLAMVSKLLSVAYVNNSLYSCRILRAYGASSGSGFLQLVAEATATAAQIGRPSSTASALLQDAPGRGQAQDQDQDPHICQAIISAAFDILHIAMRVRDTRNVVSTCGLAVYVMQGILQGDARAAELLVRACTGPAKSSPEFRAFRASVEHFLTRFVVGGVLAAATTVLPADTAALARGIVGRVRGVCVTHSVVWTPGLRRYIGDALGGIGHSAEGSAMAVWQDAGCNTDLLSYEQALPYELILRVASGGSSGEETLYLGAVLAHMVAARMRRDDQDRDAVDVQATLAVPDFEQALPADQRVFSKSSVLRGLGAYLSRALRRVYPAPDDARALPAADITALRYFREAQQGGAVLVPLLGALAALLYLLAAYNDADALSNVCGHTAGLTDALLLQRIVCLAVSSTATLEEEAVADVASLVVVWLARKGDRSTIAAMHTNIAALYNVITNVTAVSAESLAALPRMRKAGRLDDALAACKDHLYPIVPGVHALLGPEFDGTVHRRDAFLAVALQEAFAASPLSFEHCAIAVLSLRGCLQYLARGGYRDEAGASASTSTSERVIFESHLSIVAKALTDACASTSAGRFVVSMLPVQLLLLFKTRDLERLHALFTRLSEGPIRTPEFVWCAECTAQAIEYLDELYGQAMAGLASGEGYTVPLEKLAFAHRIPYFSANYLVHGDYVRGVYVSIYNASSKASRTCLADPLAFANGLFEELAALLVLGSPYNGQERSLDLATEYVLAVNNVVRNQPNTLALVLRNSVLPNLVEKSFLDSSFLGFVVADKASTKEFLRAVLELYGTIATLSPDELSIAFKEDTLISLLSYPVEYYMLMNPGSTPFETARQETRRCVELAAEALGDGISDCLERLFLSSSALIWLNEHARISLGRVLFGRNPVSNMDYYGSWSLYTIITAQRNAGLTKTLRTAATALYCDLIARSESLRTELCTVLAKDDGFHSWLQSLVKDLNLPVPKSTYNPQTLLPIDASAALPMPTFTIQAVLRPKMEFFSKSLSLASYEATLSASGTKQDIDIVLDFNGKHGAYDVLPRWQNILKAAAQYDGSSRSEQTESCLRHAIILASQYAMVRLGGAPGWNEISRSVFS